MSEKLQKPVFFKIAELKPGKHCYNIYGKVLSVNQSEITKFSGEVVRIADGVVGDETGVSNFRLTGDNVDKVKEGSIVSFRNGRSEVVDEHIRLEIDKFGKVQDEPERTFDSIKNENNISAFAYIKKERK